MAVSHANDVHMPLTPMFPMDAWASQCLDTLRKTRSGKLDKNRHAQVTA